jgi:hypothetical protein
MVDSSCTTTVLRGDGAQQLPTQNASSLLASKQFGHVLFTDTSGSERYG